MVTIIIPYFNEQDTLNILLNELEANFKSAQIILVNNNSTDNSLLMVNGFIQGKRSNSYEMLNCYDKGKGNAIKSALPYVKNDVIILQDADLEYPTYELKRMYKEHLLAKADMTVGVRKNILFRSRCANAIIRGIINWRYKSSIRDVLTGARILNKQLLYKIISNEFGIETELTKLAVKNHLNIKEVDCYYKPRIVGKKIKASHLIELIRVALC